MSFWLRWSWRDLRARWLQVLAISLIIALGTGVFAGLGGQESWRVDSLDTSTERLNMHDFKMELADGSFIDQTDLIAALDGIEGVAALEPRLIVPTLLDASTEDDTVLAQGQLVGVDVSENGPQVDSLYVDQGRIFTSDDAGQNVAMLELQFADINNVEVGTTLRISGDVELETVGIGQSPEYFAVVPPDNSFVFGEANYAVMFVPLSTAQRITDREGLINNVAFILADGADSAAVQAAVEAHMTASFPDTGLDFVTRDDDIGLTMLYSDAKNDQVTWDIVALMFLVGAALGAFNLAGRIVESQRRQIGIGMALGVSRFWIAFRPMLVGVQIAVLGTLLGLLAGIGLSSLFASLFRDILPMPYWETSLYMPGFIQATVLGILLPFAATVLPIWRAVRVSPVDAITTGNLVAKGGGLSWLANHLPLPGKSFMQMPVKNILRSPWRSLLTVLGISMAIILMTAFIGFLDSFVATLDRAEDAYLYENGDRMIVTLDRFYPETNGEIAAIRDLAAEDGSPLFAQLEIGLMLGGRLIDGDEDIDTLIELHDMDQAIWRPKLLAGELPTASDEPGIILSEKAADDLGVAVGDLVTLEHPRREGLLSFRLVQTELPVIGIHNNPVRALSYMDLSATNLVGLNDVTNLLVAKPAEGAQPDTIKLALMNQPGVASVQEIAEISESFEVIMDLFVTILQVVRIIVLFMAFLIAFNTTSINVDERVREISTMFAFGLPVRTVTRMQIFENLIIGVLGTALGLVLGWFALNAMLVARVEDQLAEFKFIVEISPETLIVSMVLGVLVVAITPLLSIRKMTRLNIPDMLRVME
ncbi:MAG: ABC transporter permease [Anaerolineae bacterium]|nr:ABC transporter permease [Anaerolineae bacterium]